MLRCPDPSCGAAVGQDMINSLASGEDKEKYFRYFIRSYVEDNRKVIVLLIYDQIVYLLYPIKMMLLQVTLSCKTSFDLI